MATTLTYRGHVRNGQIALDEPARLPEGAAVNVQVVTAPDPAAMPLRTRRQILQLPLEQRRQLLSRQSEQLIEAYLPDPQRDEWQGGDILE